MPPVPEPPVSSHLFPHPTGMNAYEDWVHAGDLIRDNTAVDAASTSPLTIKRRLLGDATIRQALDLFHEGMNKPVISPHVNVDQNTTYPELTLFRKLARLLKIEMYVQFADGRSDAAIQTFALGMRFGHQIQSDTLISGLVGIAIQNTLIREFTAHIDQLSEYQCQRVRRIVEDWQTWQSPYLSLLNSEKNSTLQMLERHRTDPKSLSDLFTAFESSASGPDEVPDPDSELEAKRIQSFMDQIKQQPAALNTLLDQIEGRIRTVYDTAIATAQHPASQRTAGEKQADMEPGQNPNTFSPADTLSKIIIPMIGPVLNRYDQMDVQMRLMGTRAAIYAYRWEYSRLPNSLADLHLGKMGIDPFTGNPFQYKQTGATFELTSKGVPTGKN